MKVRHIIRFLLNKLYSRERILVPREELPRCTWCGRRIPHTANSPIRKDAKRHFCDQREHGLWMRGRPLEERQQDPQSAQ